MADDTLRITNAVTGDVIDEWESAEYASDYLTPCDTFKFTAGADVAPIEIARRFPPGANVIVSAVLRSGREAVLLDGYVDSVEVESARSGGGGRGVTVEGRDFLGQVVDANVDPRLEVPRAPTIDQVIDLVLMKQFGLQYNKIEENIKAHQAIGPRLKKRPPTRPSRRPRKNAQAKDSEAKPRDGESAYGYLRRLLDQFGYNLSAARSPDNRYVIIAGPNYNQAEEYYTLRSLREPEGAANNVLRSTLRVDESNVPSEVIVKGGFFGPRDQKKNISSLSNTIATRLKPVFVVDQKAKDKETTQRVARAVMGKLLRNFVTYHATVHGMSDPETGALFCVDTMCNILDEDTGTVGAMWVESCTIRKSRKGGTTTDLKLILPGTLVLDWQPDEDVEGALDAGEKITQQVGAKSLNDNRSYVFKGVEVMRKPRAKPKAKPAPGAPSAPPSRRLSFPE